MLERHWESQQFETKVSVAPLRATLVTYRLGEGFGSVMVSVAGVNDV